MSAYCDPVDSNTANVTGRSEERKRSMRRRREHELVAENAALRASLERKDSGDERLAGGILSECFRWIWGIRDVLGKRLVLRPQKL